MKSTQAKYDYLVTSCSEVGHQILPKKPKKKWSNLSKRENVTKAREKLKAKSSNDSLVDINEVKKSLKEEYQLAEKSYIEQQI